MPPACSPMYPNVYTPCMYPFASSFPRHEIFAWLCSKSSSSGCCGGSSGMTRGTWAYAQGCPCRRGRCAQQPAGDLRAHAARNSGRLESNMATEDDNGTGRNGMRRDGTGGTWGHWVAAGRYPGTRGGRGEVPRDTRCIRFWSPPCGGRGFITENKARANG